MKKQAKLNLKKVAKASTPTSALPSSSSHLVKKFKEKGSIPSSNDNQSSSPLATTTEIKSTFHSEKINLSTLDNYNEKLELFDLNLNYGPGIGISRLDRWNRAERFKLSPPREILNILLDDNIYLKNKNEFIWSKMF